MNSEVFSYEQFNKNKAEKEYKRQQRYSYMYETQAEAEQALIKKIKSAYQNGKDRVQVYGWEPHVGEVVKKFQESGLENLGYTPGSRDYIYIDNRSCVQRLFDYLWQAISNRPRNMPDSGEV